MGLGRLNPKTCARFWSTRRTLVLVLPALALTLTACDWTYFGGWHVNGGSRSSPDTGIDLSNVGSLGVDWTVTTGNSVEWSSPAVANGVVYSVPSTTRFTPSTRLRGRRSDGHHWRNRDLLTGSG